MRERIKLMLVALLLLVAAGVNAQVTTSALAGVVCDEENHEALIGATVTALHEPSGTKYTTVTNLDGRFTLQGLRTGGPYRVTVSYVGYRNLVVENVLLQLGITHQLENRMSQVLLC